MISRKGVPRVVWERRRSKGGSPDGESQVDHIPFLSVSRSLGDFWSYNPMTKKFAVSPRPDVHVLPLDPSEQKFVVIATDGLWNVMSPTEVVQFIWDYETDSQKCHQPRDVVRALINEALRRWKARNLLADNIAVLIAFLTEDDSPQPASISGLSGSSCPVMTNGENREVAMNGHGDSSSSPSSIPSPETGMDSEPRENPGSPESINTSTVIRQLSTSKTGSTLYYRETLPEGVTIEYQTRIKLRHQRREKYKSRDGMSKNLGKSPRSPKMLEATKREHECEDMPEDPPTKRTKLDTDSGCDMQCVSDKLSPTESDSSSSSDVFSDGVLSEGGVSEPATGLRY